MLNKLLISRFRVRFSDGPPIKSKRYRKSENRKNRLYGLHFDYILILFLIFSSFVHAAEPINYDPSLPNVLIIGDSVSLYYPYARENLTGICNLFRIKMNAMYSESGRQNIEGYLSYTMKDGTVITKWDAIHFNWGLWDTKILDRTRTNAVPIDRYAENLEYLVKRMLQTGASLIFATTTFVPECEPLRTNADVIRYNAAALDVMTRYGVAVDDLYALSEVFPGSLYIEPCNVHHNTAGKRILADKVAGSIERALKMRWVK